MGNESGRLLHGIVLAVSLCVLIATFLVERAVRFNRQTRYILMKMRKAKEDAEYFYWHRELRCHYLRLIPFVTARNVARIYLQCECRYGYDSVCQLHRVGYGEGW